MSTSTDLKLGEFIKKLRLQKKKSLRQVESDTGISNAHLFQIEKGTISQPSLTLLKNLSEYFQVDLKYLKQLAGLTESAKSLNLDDYIRAPFKYLTATQLNQYSTTKGAEGILPELIRDLIVSTVSLDLLKMPVGESVFMHGWDGQLRCLKSGIQFIPEGCSYWELSKSGTPSTKTFDDFTKRTNNPLEATPETSHYIQVTFKRLSEKTKLRLQKEINEANKQSKASWKSVTILDAEDLELWLQKAPVVALTYAKKIGTFPPTEHLQPLSEFWDEWFSNTEPPMDQELLLEAGTRCSDDVDSFVSGKTDHLTIQANDWKMGAAYLYSKLCKIEDKILAFSLLSRSILVHNEDAFRMLSTRNRNLILIPTFNGAPIGEAKTRGHKIVTLKVTFHENDLKVVGRVKTATLVDYLKSEGGYTDEKAYRVARSCYGNLSVLRSMLAEQGHLEAPSWSGPEKAHFLLPLVLLGGWNSENENDRKIIESITGSNYESIETSLNSLPADRRVLFEKTDGVYKFYQEYCLSYLNNFISPKILDAYFKIAVEVLSALDTKYDLEPDQRFSASLYQKGNQYSKPLRVGVASTLAMFGNFGVTGVNNLKGRIDQLVADILSEKSDWKFWASLSENLLMLAEASPDSFLSKIEAVCDKKDFVEIFKQTTSLGGCEYSSILWALESCAWSKQHFKQVTKILMKMSDHQNVSSNYVNQPTRSLADIYRVWLNQSTLTFEERMKILRECEPFSPHQAWTLAINMIPEAGTLCQYTYRPRYREIENSPEQEQDYLNVIEKITDYILELLEKEPARWVDAIELVFKIRPKSFQSKLIKKLKELDRNKLTEPALLLIWKELEKKLSNHMEFQDAEWSIKGNTLATLKEVYYSLSPSDKLQKWQHVFDFYVAHPDTEKFKGDYHKKQRVLRELQQKALQEIISVHGIDVLKTMIQSVPSAYTLGLVAGTVLEGKFKECISLGTDDRNGKLFVNGIIASLYSKGGIEWFDLTLRDEFFNNPNRRAELFLSAPFTPDITKRLEFESEELNKLYWTGIGNLYLTESAKDAVYVIEKFLEYGRSLDAFNVLANFEIKGKEDIPSPLALKVLEAVMEHDFSDKSKTHSMTLFDYHLEKILKELGQRADTDKRKLALIEWNFLPLFKYSKRPMNLTREVINDPKMFVDILKLAYKQDDKTTEDKVNEAAALRAYQFLHYFKTVPGVDDKGTFDPGTFQRWFSEVRGLATDCNRLQICDRMIGQILSYSPFDPEDNGWPHKNIRDVFEKYGTEGMERGLHLGIFNKRGAFTKSVGEGGVQERKIAQKYGEYANICELHWPKIAKVFRALEQNYTADAIREDSRALRD